MDEAVAVAPPSDPRAAVRAAAAVEHVPAVAVQAVAAAGDQQRADHPSERRRAPRSVDDPKGEMDDQHYHSGKARLNGHGPGGNLSLSGSRVFLRVASHIAAGGGGGLRHQNPKKSRRGVCDDGGDGVSRAHP